MDTFKTYNSVAELSAALSGKVINEYTAKYNRDFASGTERENKSFAGVSGLAEAQKLLVYGDAKAAQKIKAVGDFKAPEKENKPILTTGVVGCLPHIPNYLRGVPNSMMQIKSNARKKPIINIFVECTINDGINTTELAKKCAIIANSIAAIELNGYRINLNAICGSGNSRNKAGFCVNIKKADAPLNLLNIAFPLTNKAFCRAIYLRWADTNVKSPLDSSWAVYGSILDKSEIKKKLNIDGLFISMVELVRHDTTQKELEKEINKYLSENNR